MAADEVQRLDLEDLDAVLARAKAERWTELALVARSAQIVPGLIRDGWSAQRTFVLAEPLGHVPAALVEIASLTSLHLSHNQIGDVGAAELAKLHALTSLDLRDNQIGHAGAAELARLNTLTSLDLTDNPIGPAGAAELARLGALTSLSLGDSGIGDAGAAELARLGALTSLSLFSNQIGDAGAAALASLSNLTSLDLGDNQIGDAGAADLARLSSLISLGLGENRIGDAGAAELARLSALTSLILDRNGIGDSGAIALARLSALTLLNLHENRIGDAGAAALARLENLTNLSLNTNGIGEAGGRAILDAWADPATAERRRLLSLIDNTDVLKGILPAEFLDQNDAQVLIAAWRRRKELEAGRAPLPTPEAVGEPVSHGVQVGTAADGRLTLVDPEAGSGARDDEIGRELHQEVIAALDRLISAAGRSNVVAEWREAAAAAKERLGNGPDEVRVSAILRIERLRSLREADQRRRSEPDPLDEPAEAGVAAALRDAVAAANLYVATDPFLAERQNQLIDPRIQPALSVEEAAAAEADLDAVGIADEALLDELRLARETARMAGEAGRQARVWLDGSWRNVTVEVLRKALAWIHMQADHAAMHVRLGAAVTIDDAASMLVSMRLLGRQSASALSKTGRKGARLSARAFAASLGTVSAPPILYGSFAWLEHQFAILPKLGFPPEFVARLHQLLFLAG